MNDGTAPLVTVNISEPASALPPPPERMPFITYEERFEREGKWFLGPMILANICRYMRGKSLVASFDRESPNSILISLPEFPRIHNELGKSTTIYWMIPEELRGIFYLCCAEIMAYRENDVREIYKQLLPCVADQFAISRANAILRQYEDMRIAKNDSADPPLWKCFAERLGLNPIYVEIAPEPFVENQNG